MCCSPLVGFVGLDDFEGDYVAGYPGELRDTCLGHAAIWCVASTSGS